MLSTLALCSAALLLYPSPQASQSSPVVTSSLDGCGTSTGQLPTLQSAGDLALGTGITLNVQGAAPLSQVIFVVGSSPTSGRLGQDCSLTVAPDLVMPPQLADSEGVAAFELPLTFAVQETDIFVQAAISDPDNPGGFAFTNSLFLDFEVEDIATSKIVEAFAGSNALAADAAYLELLHRDVDGIEELIALASSNSGLRPYSGYGYYDSRSSWLSLEPVPLQRMSLYVVDAILHKTPAPAHAPIACLNAPSGDADAEALNAFQQWWANNSELTLKELRTVVRGPFAGNTLTWAGGYLPFNPSPTLNAIGGPGAGTGGPGTGGVGTGGGGTTNGNEQPGSSTPLKVTVTGAAIVESVISPGHYDFKGCGAEPYNCLAWALDCHKDRWCQPGGGATIDDIMRGAGYVPSTEFVGPALEKVELSYNGAAVDGNWSHAIKLNNATGKASSKNGQSSLYLCITDTDDFRDDHYTPGATVVTWCR